VCVLICRVREAGGSSDATNETYELSPTPRLFNSASVVITRTAEEQTA
jgi:hypothetical protein